MAQLLADRHGLASVGAYLAGAAVLSIAGLLAAGRGGPDRGQDGVASELPL